jgi:acyl dehydratase
VFAGAGRADLLLPPTFLFCLEMASPDPAAMRTLLDIDIAQVLHGEQHFAYHAPVRAGDRLRFAPRIADIYDKKGGALQFVVRETEVTNQHGVRVAELRCVTVVRRPAEGGGSAPAKAVAAEAAPASRTAAPFSDAVQVGDELPMLTTEPISRLQLALYCGASGDHNPIHVDIDFARRAGMDDVFAHGMLSMATLGRLVTDWAGAQALRSFGVRFAAITHVGDAIACTGRVIEKLDGEEPRVRLALTAADQRGETKLAGEAVVALPRGERK